MSSHPRYRLALITHRSHQERAEGGFHTAVGRHFDLSTHYVEDGWPRRASDVAGLSDADAALFYVRFRDLQAREPFDWEGFAGSRLVFDQDAYLNFSSMSWPNPYQGAWPSVFDRNRFDILLTTGRETRDRLTAVGVPAHWLAKAYDDSVFFDTERTRDGVCFFGSEYLSRRLMLRALERQHVAFTRFSCKYSELNDHLNRYAACLMCNMGVAFPPMLGQGTRARLVVKFAPTLGLRPVPGIEPMQKLFEVAGSGCVPIVDELPELAELGYLDGETAVTYASFDELADKVRDYITRPEDLAAIGRAAAELSTRRHTWDHRAAELETLLASLSAA